MAGGIGGSAGLAGLTVGSSPISTVSVGESVLWQANGNNQVAYTLPFTPAPAPPPPPPPPPPPALAVTNVGSATISVAASGTPPEGFGAVVGYNFYRGGTRRNSLPVADGLYTFTGLTGSTAYNVAFTFVNGSGVESAQFGLQTITTVAANTELPAATRNAIDAILQDLVLPAPGAADGAMVHVSTPDGEYAKAFGGDRTAGRPLSLDLNIRYGSITKLYTHQLIMKRIAEGRLTLDNKLADFVTGIPNGNQITILMLITMTSGIHDYLQADAAVQQTYFLQPTAAFDPMPYIKSYAPDFPPGQPPATWFAGTGPGGNGTYSNSNTVLLAKILEELDRQVGKNRAFPAILKEDLLEPYGLTKTWYPTGVTPPTPYMRAWTPNLALPQIQAMLGPLAFLAGLFGYPTAPELEWSAVHPGYAGAAGAVGGTIADLVKFGKAVYNDPLTPELDRLGKEFFPHKYAKYTPASPEEGPGVMEFGLKGIWWGRWFGWIGNIGGYYAVMFCNIDDGTVIALATNNFSQGPVGAFYKIAYLLNQASTQKAMDRVVRPQGSFPARSRSVGSPSVYVARPAGDADGRTQIALKVPFYV